MGVMPATQTSFLDAIPVKALADQTWFSDYLQSADLADLPCEYESWQIMESSAELSYLTHGVFRYFGKFPPPVARRFINELHDPDCGPVVDCMMGSGTTLVEAVIEGRAAVGLDASPLSCLVSKVKTTPISVSRITRSLDRYNAFMNKTPSGDYEQYIPKDAYLAHWFWPETQVQLARTRQFIETALDDKDVHDAFLVVLAGIVRRVSRASNGLGRMFLDPAIPVLNAAEHFTKKAMTIVAGLASLEDLHPRVDIRQNDARNQFLAEASTNLVICHPPYFNVYRYSSIYKFELMWLGFDYSRTRKLEVRDGFKIGKRELVHEYVADMGSVFENIERVLVPGGACVLMVGDTYLREERINTTSLLLAWLSSSDLDLQLERLIIRHPKFTEASYASTQRRAGKDLGIKLPDHILVLRKPA